MPAYILVVDDDEMIRKLVTTTLEGKGYTVDTAAGGREALDKALERKPDLIITDVMMPGMDGFTFVDRMRSHRELILVPVIFLTALDNAKDRFHGFRLGAEDYVPKPFNPERLLQSVEKVLERNNRLYSFLQDELCDEPELRSGEQGEKIAFEGDIEQVSVPTILTIMEMERNSGLLLFQGPRSGRLFIKEGQIVDVEFEDNGEPSGRQGLFDMLAWKRGKFELYYMDINLEDRIQTSTTALILEGARLLDESTREEENTS